MCVRKKYVCKIEKGVSNLVREWLAPFWLVLLEGDNMSQRLVHIECLCELLLFAILVGQLISGPYI